MLSMRQRDLEMFLSKVPPFPAPDPRLEQYLTPPDCAAWLIHRAFMEGDIKDRKVADLGCGTGILSVGCSLMGASNVTGFDIDGKAIRSAKEWAHSLELDIDFFECEISKVDGEFDTVVMNPPFGAQKRHADAAFIDKALGISKVVYCILNRPSLDWLGERLASANWEIDWAVEYEMTLPHVYDFHSREKGMVKVVLTRFHPKTQA